MRERKTLNKPLLRKLATKLRRLRHEEHFDQTVWAQKTACGTVACLAGHAVAMSGWRLIPIAQDEDPDAHNACVRNGKERPVQDVAAALIGLKSLVDSEGYVFYSLFSEEPEIDWPEPFATRWKFAVRGMERPSRVAADLLDAIADGKVTL